MAKIKKAQKGGSVDSSAIYKKRAEDAGNKLLKDDVRNFGKNVKDFATKQADSKRYERKGKPGYDAQGNRKPLSSMLKFKKSKEGGSFPDLNKDGKVTKKDVLIGRGVLPKTAKKGVKMKKAQDGEKLKVALRAGQLKRLGRLSAKNPEKAEKVGKSMVERATRKQRGVEYLKKNAPALKPSSIKSSVEMKKGGKLKKARSGATLSPSNKSTSSNLAGYKRVIGKSMRMGGSMKKCRGGCY